MSGNGEPETEAVVMKSWLQGLFSRPAESVLQLILIAAILIIFNYIAYNNALRLDLTDDRRYTLSENSEEILNDLRDPVTLTAYFSDDLPPDFNRAARELRHLISYMARSSDTKITYRERNPSRSEEDAERAERAGIYPVTLDVRQQDRITQRQIYMGVTLEYGDEMEVMPFMQPEMPLEYELASALSRMVYPVRPVVGLVQGHGQPLQDEMSQFLNQLDYRYRIHTLDNLEEGIPESVDILAIIAPQQQLSEPEQETVYQFLAEGGRAFFALNRFETNPGDGTAKVVHTGLESLLAEYGVSVDSTLIRDRNSSMVRVPGQAGQFGYANQVEYPLIPVIREFADHPVTSGISSVVFQFLSPVSVVHQPDHIELHELAWTSEQTGLMKEDFNLDPMQEWSGTDFLESYLPVGVAARGVLAGIDSSPESALVVFGDGNFLINAQGGQEQELPADNVHLALNAIDWLADDTGLINLRTRITQSRPLQSVDSDRQTLIAYANVIFPILLITLFGGVRLLRYRSKRAKLQKRWSANE